MEEHIFITNGRKATLLKAKKENCPLIILNNFSRDSAPIVKAMHRVRTPDCHLLIIGCGGICYQEEMPSPDNPGGTNGYLMNIYTLPELRGEGIGREIVEFLIEDAKKRGTGKIYLESSAMAKNSITSLGSLICTTI